MSPLFHGPVRHWAMLAIVIGLLSWMGFDSLHVRHYDRFLVALIAISFGIVVFAVATYRKGEHVTREPFEDEDGD